MEARSFVKYADEQIPDRLKDSKYSIFQDLLKKRNITTLEELEDFLSKREAVLLDFLKHEKSPNEGHLKEKAVELEFLKQIRRNFLKYL